MTDIICEYKNICLNYKKECDRCSFNQKLEFRNYLKINKDGKEIHYLGDSDG